MLQFANIFDRLFTYGINQHDSEDSLGEGFVVDAINVDVEGTSLTRRKGHDVFAGDVPLRVDSMVLTAGTASQPIAFPAGVDVGTNVITTSGAHGWSTGQMLCISTTGTSLPSPLVIDTVYYAIVTGASTLKLATTAALATMGTAIDLAAGLTDVTTLAPPNKLDISLPSYVDLGLVVPGPIEVELYYYKSGAASPTSFTHRYTEDEWVRGDRITLTTAGMPQSVYSYAQTGIVSKNSLLTFGTTDSASEEIYPDGVSLDVAGALNALTVAYGVSADLPVYVAQYNTVDLYRTDDVKTEAGVTVTDAGGHWTITIPSSEHLLNSGNILPRLFVSSAANTVFTEIFADEITISATLTVTIELWGLTLNAGETVAALLVHAGTANMTTGTLYTGGGILSTTHNIPDASTKHLIAACYTRAIDGTLTYVYPDSVIYAPDPVLPGVGSHDITFTHGTSTGNYRIVYVYATTSANKITIDNMHSAPITTATQSIERVHGIVRGIAQSELPVKTLVNYIDAYPSNDETVIGCDGLIYRSTVDTTVESLDVRVRVNADTVVGPTFVPVAGLLVRTLGNIVTTSAGMTGMVPVTAVTWMSVKDVKFTLEATAHTGDPTSIISTSRDYLTVSGVPNARFNGTFKITGVTHDTNNIYITATTTLVDKAIWNMTGTRGAAGIFTDEIIFESAVTAGVGSTFVLSPTVSVTVASMPSTSTAWVSGAISLYAIAGGRLLGYSDSASAELLLTSGLLYAGAAVNVTPMNLLGVLGTPIYTTVLSAADGVVTFRDVITVTEGRCDVNIPYYWELIRPADNKLGDDLIDRTDIIRSVAGRGSLYLSNGVKYDGDKLYRTGMPSLQSQLFIMLDESATDRIPVVGNIQTFSYAAGTGTEVITVTEGVASLSPGDTLLAREISGGAVVTVNPTAVYTVKDTDTTAKTITLNSTYTKTGATAKLTTYVEYDYYLRLSIIDSHGNQIVGPSTGTGDLRVRLTANSAVRIRGTILASGVENIDYARLNIEVFRRNNTALAGGFGSLKYYKVGQVPMSGLHTYFDFTDSRDDKLISATDVDPIVDLLSGGIGETRSAPYRAESITAINNQLVYSNLTTEPQIRLSLIGDVAIAAPLLDKIFAVRVYDTETGVSKTATSFKVVNETYDVAITGTAGASFTATVTGHVDLDLAAGAWVYIARKTDTTVVDGTRFLGWWQITSAAENGGDTAIVVTWSNVLAEDVDLGTAYGLANTTGLTMYYITNGTSATVPLADNPAHFNMGQAIGYHAITGAAAIFPYHLASAINSVYMQLSGAASVTGIYARGGRDLTSGFLSLCGTRLYSFTNSAAVTGLSVFSSGTLISASAEILALAGTYSARSILSIPRFPEVFSDIDADSSQQLPSIQDVNPDDGDSITAAIPFFADSAFGAAQRSSTLVYFKEHSIYIMDIALKNAGQADFFKRIESRGLGCEAPGSVSASADGIFFASRAGIIMLSKSQDMINVGHKIEKMWEHLLIDRTKIARICGSNYPTGRQYRASVPLLSDDANYNGGVLSFKFGEDEMAGVLPGAWTRYSGIYATCYSNRGGSVYFASDRGYVGRMLDAGTALDYADLGLPITCDVTFRATSADMPFNRKVLKFITMYLESKYDAPHNDIEVYCSNDFNEEWQLLDDYNLSGSALVNLTDLGDPSRDKIARVAFSPRRSHATWFQIRLTASTVHADFGINKLVYTIASLRTRGVAQAKQT